MKIAILGGTGFVGSYLVDALVASGHQPILLVRPGHEDRVRHPAKCISVTGQVGDSAAVSNALCQADAVIYNIGILREFPARGITFEELHFKALRRCVDAAQHLGVKRLLLMSANGASTGGTAYQRSKRAAEDYLAASELDWTVFRPSVIFGDPRGRMEFASQLARDVIDGALPAPLFYDGLVPRNPGSFCLSPVHVADVAEAFVRALGDRGTYRQTLHLGGPASLSWRAILETIAAACGRKKHMLPVPAFGISTAAALFDRFEKFPVTREQIDMLLQGNTCDSGDLQRLGIQPRPFDVASLGYLNAGQGRQSTWQKNAA